MTNLWKRLCTWASIWTLFWLLCFQAFLSSPDPVMAQYQVWATNNPMMWLTILDRMLIWFFVWMAWIMTHHPLFWFKLPVFLRWAVMWLLISSLIAIWVFMWPEWTMSNLNVFWLIMWLWAIIWMIIDLILTKFYWEGEKLNS